MKSPNLSAAKLTFIRKPSAASSTSTQPFQKQASKKSTDFPKGSCSIKASGKTERKGVISREVEIMDGLSLLIPLSPDISLSNAS